jgi:Fur family transcriptional regulator, peroxide stress response regulator
MDRQTHLTPQRRAVYEVIQQAHDHPTAADIMERLRLSGQKISYATVYNSLKYLTDSGIVRELKIGETVSRYDARMEAHHHIVCEKCGQVDELLTPLEAAYLRAVSTDTGYEVHDVDVIAKGLCPKCRSEFR